MEQTARRAGARHEPATGTAALALSLLAGALSRSRVEAQELRTEIGRLWTANAELALERDVTDELFGQAIDLLREGFGGDW